MININGNFHKLDKNYLFSEIDKKIACKKNAKLYKLGIGDVTLPIPKFIAEKMSDACKELSTKKGFKGYPPTTGYPFLKDAIVKNYGKLGVNLQLDEIFVSDGAKTDIFNVLDIFERTGAYITTPFYPVYKDANTIKNNKIRFVLGNEDNGFLPLPNKKLKKGIYFISSPNNPTGTVYGYDELNIWVDFAVKTDSLIIFDTAYAPFITENKPKSIFEIEKSRKCAIEINSFSKSAGFTGIRCSYVVIPKELSVNGENVNKLFLRRQCSAFNGVSYVTQVGAYYALSDEGLALTQKNVNYYKKNAKILADFFEKKGVTYFGAKNSPYVFSKTVNGASSWDFFDVLLSNNIVATPGVGFGSSGEGFMRFSAFASRNDVINAIKIMNYVY